MDVPVPDFGSAFRGGQESTVGWRAHFHASQSSLLLQKVLGGRHLNVSQMSVFKFLKQSWYPKVKNGHLRLYVRCNFTDTRMR